MSMTKCHECEAAISATADKCPHCGAANVKGKAKGCLWGLVILVGLVVLIGMCVPEEEGGQSASESTESPAEVGELAPDPVAEKEALQKQRAEQFEELLRAEIGEPAAKWSRVEVREAEERSYSIRLRYPEAPNSYSLREVERDTVQVGRAALAVLMAQGRQPQQERTYIGIHASEQIQGETGGDMHRVLGMTYYDHNSDQLIYRAP